MNSNINAHTFGFAELFVSASIILALAAVPFAAHADGDEYGTDTYTSLGTDTYQMNGYGNSSNGSLGTDTYSSLGTDTYQMNGFGNSSSGSLGTDTYASLGTDTYQTTQSRYGTDTYASLGTDTYQAAGYGTDTYASLGTDTYQAAGYGTDTYASLGTDTYKAAGYGTDTYVSLGSDTYQKAGYGNNPGTVTTAAGGGGTATAYASATTYATALAYGGTYASYLPSTYGSSGFYGSSYPHYSYPYTYPVTTGGGNNTYTYNTNTCTGTNNCNNVTTTITNPPVVVTQPSVTYASYSYSNPPVYVPPPIFGVAGNPSISLSSLPYTGLELGFWGTVAYWTFLILWCLVAAYLIAVKRVQNTFVSFLFGETVVAHAAASTVGAHTAHTVAVAAHQVAQPVAHAPHIYAPIAPSDAIDPFILSQIARSARA